MPGWHYMSENYPSSQQGLYPLLEDKSNEWDAILELNQ